MAAGLLLQLLSTVGWPLRPNIWHAKNFQLLRDVYECWNLPLYFQDFGFQAHIRAPTEVWICTSQEDLYPPIPMKEVRVTQTIPNLVQWSRQQGINYRILRELNPWIRDTSLVVKPGSVYTIKIAKGKYADYDALLRQSVNEADTTKWTGKRLPDYKLLMKCTTNFGWKAPGFITLRISMLFSPRNKLVVFYWPERKREIVISLWYDICWRSAPVHGDLFSLCTSIYRQPWKARRG